MIIILDESFTLRVLEHMLSGEFEGHNQMTASIRRTAAINIRFGATPWKDAERGLVTVTQ